jgi:hypothetical protein
MSVIGITISPNALGQATVGGGTVVCFFQSREVEDFDYYDCGTCEKIDGRMGYGSSLSCSTST